MVWEPVVVLACSDFGLQTCRAKGAAICAVATANTELFQVSSDLRFATAPKAIHSLADLGNVAFRGEFSPVFALEFHHDKPLKWYVSH